MSNSAGGERLKIKGGVSDASINIEVDSRESSADAGQLSGSTSGVSSACSGSLQQLSGGGVTPEVSDPNTSLTEKCELNAKGMLNEILYTPCMVFCQRSKLFINLSS